MPENNLKKYALHIFLFVLTLATTTMAGAEWIGLRELNWHEIKKGLYYSIPFLGILTVHEFGHYFTAKYYKVKVSLPYYIPLYFPGITLIGTMGAVIRMKSQLKSKKEIFDIGIAGPLAGFVAALIVLFYGFTHLPPAEYIYSIHPEYKAYGLNYADHVYQKANLDSTGAILISVGDNLLFKFFEKYVASDAALVPNHYELMHYPIIFAGFLALFFTALNLIPIGQLDGGHVMYGLFGYEKQKIISPILFVVFVFLSSVGFLRESFGLHPVASFDDLLSFAPFYIFFLLLVFSKISEKMLNNLLIAVFVFATQFFTIYFFPMVKGFEGWFLFAILIGRFLGIYHPRAFIEEPLDTKRKILGWIALIVFVICFSPEPLIME